MAQIVVLNSIQKSSGKTLLTAHLGVLLAGTYRTAVMDTLNEDSPLSMFVAKRYTANLDQNYHLAVPNYHTLRKGILNETAERYDVILSDSPDESFLPETDILITTVSGQEGLAALTDKESPYAERIWQAKKTRAAGGKSAFRWIVIPNGLPHELRQSFDLEKSGKLMGFSVAPSLTVRTAYAAGLKSGLTVSDKDLPTLKPLFSLQDLYARRELKKIAEFIWQKG